MEQGADYDFSISNEELLELVKRQDQEALRLLFRRHERPIYSLLFRMLNNHEDAEEALADVFVKVWRGAASFKGSAKFTTWLFTIASNTARDRLRSRKTRQEVAMEDVVINGVRIWPRSGVRCRSFRRRTGCSSVCITSRSGTTRRLLRSRASRRAI